MTDSRHWLYRPQNHSRLWKWGALLLLLSVVAEIFVDVHPGFGFADWFGFNAVFGFVSCLGMVVFSKWLGGRIKRPQDYYAGDPGAENNEPALFKSSNPVRPPSDSSSAQERSRP